MSTASQAAKERGLDSLKQLSELSDVPTKTLSRWYHTHPKRFDALIRGAHDIILQRNAVRLRELQRAQA